LSSNAGKPPPFKRLKATYDIESLAQAVYSLAPTKEKHQQRMLLVAEEMHHKCNQENRDSLSCKCSEYEKFLSDSINWPQDIKDKMPGKNG